MAGEENPEFVAEALERIERLQERLQAIAAADHYYIGAGGQVVTDPRTGRPVPDYGPKIRALTSMRHLTVDKARLLGIDLRS